MGRPEFSLMARQQRTIADNVGETALWRRYVSSDAPNAANEAAGIGASLYDITTTITGLFAPISLPEIYQAGGQLITGDMAATLIDAQPGAQDEVVWRGVNYRIASDPIQQQLLGRSAYRFILRRGQATGG